MSCYTHEPLFRCSFLEVKVLVCTSPVDTTGFDDAYDASRISIVRSGAFARIIDGAALHELLALIDALREGRVRERQSAEKELSARLRRLLRG